MLLHYSDESKGTDNQTAYQKRKEEHLRRLSSPSVWMASTCRQWPPSACAAPARSVGRNRYVSETRREQWASRTPASALALALELSMRVNNSSLQTIGYLAISLMAAQYVQYLILEALCRKQELVAGA